MSESGPYHDVRGSGPVLLVLPGGAGHPMGLDPLLDRLAARFTVVTYDPLGLAHGRLGLPVEDQRVERWSDGARHVLDAALPDGEPAYVVGFSSGGIAALDLLARHPQRIAHVVAHEPPCVTPLPDGERQRARFQEVVATYRAAGPEAAASRLHAVLEERERWEPPHGPVPAGDGEQTVTEGRPLGRQEELNHPMALFLRHVLGPFTAYVPDRTALAAAHRTARLTLAAGTDSRGQLLHRTAGFLAGWADGDFAEFPGGHVGAATHAGEFADRLAGLLSVSRPD
ncbi:alpha/beta fold hydrolase [Streptomyces griseosporeus]|uniref:alpha/beta fold hydrolase n=1 Tax=Streptomyces griseosporeus TaxID=1910 RepID=UPI0036F4B6ED